MLVTTWETLNVVRRSSVMTMGAPAVDEKRKGKEVAPGWQQQLPLLW